MKAAAGWKNYLLCLLIVSMIFLGLYHPFLFGGSLYAYDDIGGDTIHQYLPLTEYELKLISRGADGTYALDAGLGSYQGGLLAKYLFPLQLPLLIFGVENIHIGILIRMFLSYIAIGLFGLAFFQRLLKNSKTGLVCALLWTFCAYNVLWGQHYSFHVHMAAFSMAAYGFQLYLEEDKKWHLVIPFMAVLLGRSYYYTYMSMFFFFLYGVLFLVFQKRSFFYILKRIGFFVLAMLPAVCMAAVYLTPSLESLFRSSRLQTNVSSGFDFSDKLHAPLTIFTFLTRLVSTNLLGVGNNFYATINYYECAALAVSLLFIFAFFYMMQTRHWLRVLLITGFCTVALCMPITSQILQFASMSQRWTFLLSFCQVILIGFAISDIYQNRTEPFVKRKVLIAVILFDLVLIGFLGLLYLMGVRRDSWCNTNALLITGAIAAGYHIALLFLWKSKHGYVALVAMVAIELVLANYATVNQRIIPTVDQWNNSYAHDGTEQVVQWIREQDDSLYRINKTYRSLSDNDSLLQGYNGMGRYRSTLPAPLLNVARTYGYSPIPQRVNFLNNTVMENTMLGVKYVICQAGTELDPAFYTRIYESDTHWAYRNEGFTGFGYVYQNQMAQNSLQTLPAQIAPILLSEYYFITGDDSAVIVDGTEKLISQSLLENITDASQCVITPQDGYYITGTGAQMALTLELNEQFGSGVLYVDVYTSIAEQMQLLDANGQLLSAQAYAPAQNTVALPIYAGENTRQVTLVLSGAVQNMMLQNIRLVYTDNAQLQTNLKSLRAQGITDIDQEGNTFQCAISVDSDSMLCIPLIYSDNWKASVDGVSVEIENVNGGLVGIPLGSGVHQIQLTYTAPLQTIGTVCSLVSFLGYLAVLAFLHLRKKNK